MRNIKEELIKKTNSLNEVDLFIELLDVKATDNIIKKFREPVVGFMNPSIDKKKQHIKKIFKRQTPRTRGSMNKNVVTVDPFIICVKSFEIELLKSIDKKDVFKFISNLYDVADYVKFANAFLYCNEELKQELPNLFKNLNEGRSVFQNEDSTLSYEEAYKIFFARVLYNGEDGMKKLYQEIHNFLPENFKEKANELIPKIEKMSFEEFISKLADVKDEAPDYLIYFIYGLTHSSEKQEILLTIATIISKELISYYYKKNNESVLALENIEKSLDKLNLKFLKTKEKNEEVSKIREESHNWKKKFELEKEENRKNKLRFSKLEEKLNDNQINIKELEKIIESEKQTNEKRIRQINEEKQKINVDFENLKTQFNNLGIESNNSFVLNFSMIYSSETILFDSIFKEVNAVHISKWIKEKHKIITSYTNKIYVQRDGISTKKLQEIEKEALINDIKIETFLASSPKELLEKLAYFKYKEREII